MTAINPYCHYLLIDWFKKHFKKCPSQHSSTHSDVYKFSLCPTNSPKLKCITDCNTRGNEAGFQWSFILECFNVLASGRNCGQVLTVFIELRNN